MSTNSRIHNEIVALYEDSKVLIDMINRLDDIDDMCSCLPLIVEILIEMHSMSNSLICSIDGLLSNTLDRQISLALTSSRYRLDSVIRYIHIILKNNPCSDRSIEQDIYLVIGLVHENILLTSKELAGVISRPSNIDQCRIQANNHIHSYNDDVPNRIRDALYSLEQTRRMTDILLDPAKGSTKELMDGLVDSIDKGLEKTIYYLSVVLDLSNRGVYRDHYVEIRVNLEVSIGLLKATREITSIIGSIQINPMEMVRIRCYLSTDIYTVIFTSLIKSLKSANLVYGTLH